MRERANSRVLNPALPQALVTSPCEVSARFARFVFSILDEDTILTVDTTSAPGRYTLTVAGALRAELTTFRGFTYPDASPNGDWLIRCVQEGLNGRVRLDYDGMPYDPCTEADYQHSFAFDNPAQDFGNGGTRVPSAHRESVSAAAVDFGSVVTPRTGVAVVTARTGSCDVTTDASGAAFMLRNGEWWRFDLRAKYVLNTPESPSTVGSVATTLCPLAPISYQNEFDCVLRPECGGSLPTFNNVQFTLDSTTIREWYNDASARRYVYTIRGLTLTGPYAVSPCLGSRSRWENVGSAGSCSQTSGVDATTRATLAAAISSADGSNALLRDVVVIPSASCTASSATIGATIAADGACWTNIHPDEYSVRDATYWNGAHDGNAAAADNGNPNPIAAFANSGSTTLFYPGSHPMDRWDLRSPQLPVVGRLGDTISFNSLTYELQTTAFALYVGAISSLPTGGSMACGSYDEVPNKPELGEHYTLGSRFIDFSDEISARSTENREETLENTGVALNNVMHKASDQLRQRVAWTLSNIFVMSTVTLDTFQERPEGFLHYYDAFTRHAFGSFSDILKHVSYSRFMGTYLTYLDSRSYAASGSFPDENYAREIMQLFSIGLTLLNDDGTPILDGPGGDPLPTYDQEDIVDYARVWTGFEASPERTNSIDDRGAIGFDTMRINTRFHDVMPKLGLGAAGGYLGDTYPLCNELPPTPWLTTGARYRFVGTSSGESTEIDGSDNDAHGRFEPASDGSSGLFNILCARPSPSEPCSWPSAVTLSAPIPCSSAEECNAGSLVTVKIVDPISGDAFYYRHRGVPCTRFSFFDNGRVVSRFGDSACANPRDAAALPLCCSAGSLTEPVEDVPGICMFNNEWVSFTDNEARCAAQGLVPCAPPPGSGFYGGFPITCAFQVQMWSAVGCSVQVQVYPSGKVGAVDPLAPSILNVLQASSGNVFRVRWDTAPATATSGGSCPAGCTPTATVDGTSCLCSVSVTESPAFASASALSSLSAEEVAAAAPVGAMHPSLYGPGAFSLSSTTGAGVEVWVASGESAGSLGLESIFVVPPRRAGGRVRCLRNKVSTVLVGSSGAHRFRNPVSFTNYVGWGDFVDSAQSTVDLREQKPYDEIDAMLEMLSEHDATAPFICWRLAQFMVTSNPSPRYMTAIVDAFRSGVAVRGDGSTFTMSGKYGDLGAAVYTMLADREARNSVLMADPSFGMVSDPLVSLHRALRSLEYVSHSQKEVKVFTIEAFGVAPMKAPSVFNFYLPENQPPGGLSDAGLFAPAAQLATAPNLIGLLNGLHSLVDHGLTNCFDGFGDALRTPGCAGGDASLYSDGSLTYFDTAPARHAGMTTEEIVDELGLVLSGGRMMAGTTTRATAISEYNRVLGTSGAGAALRHTVKIILSSPEFHTASPEVASAEVRSLPSPAPTQNRPMKTIIYFFLDGGADTFTALAPHTCSGGVRAQYESVRSSAAGPLSGHQINNVGGDPQPCSTFVMSEELDAIHSLYNDGDAVWMANIGALVEPTTMQEYEDKSTALPGSLFAHNKMQYQARSVVAGDLFASGVMARLGEAVSNPSGGVPPYRLVQQSVAGTTHALGGTARGYNIVSSGDTQSRLNSRAELQTGLDQLLSHRPESPFSDFFGNAVLSAIDFTETLVTELATVTLAYPNWDNGDFIIRTSPAMRQAKRIAELMINANSNGVERAQYYMATAGWDTHNSVDLAFQLDSLDEAMRNLAEELKLQGLWDDTTIVIASEFARTLTFNGRGTDHAWGGQSLVLGGGVDGGRILGEYIDEFGDDGTQVISNGRVLPTLAWESMWIGVAEWFGVAADQMDYVLPNAANFGEGELYRQNELYE